jgi:hypothetical protein
MTSNVDQEGGGSYKQLIWDGKNPNWIIWETKMQARAVTKRWYDVMIGLPEDVPADLIVWDEDNVAHMQTTSRSVTQIVVDTAISYRLSI